MYIPKLNTMTDTTEIVEFMRRFSFATIITSKDNFPIATHLPFLVTQQDKKITLTSHFAKANEHWKEIEQNRTLVIFSEPHAYISPSHYDHEMNVPTWNYLAVHAYGQGKLVTKHEEAIAVLESTIDQYEAAYKVQWDKLPADYKSGLSKGIVAFHIEVDEIQAKKKLSQNKTENEQKRIIDALSKSPETTEQIIAKYMLKNNH